MFVLLLGWAGKIAAVAMIEGHRRMSSIAVSCCILWILIVLLSLVCFTSAARQSAVFNTGMGEKNVKKGSKPFIDPCHSKSNLPCSPPPRQMEMNGNTTAEEKRVVPTGPNPLHNR
ncbi:hypothetical protein SUGI_0536890 [Cryptomeria japonica]|nr:hypothetical protein SUGI_0536890 [Cryptomeria japonica]